MNLKALTLVTAISSIALVAIGILGRLFGYPPNGGIWVFGGFILTFLAVIFAAKQNEVEVEAAFAHSLVRVTLYIVIVLFIVAFTTSAISSGLATISGEEVIYDSRETYWLRNSREGDIKVSALRYHIVGVSHAIAFLSGPMIASTFAIQRALTGKWWPEKVGRKM